MRIEPLNKEMRFFLCGCSSHAMSVSYEPDFLTDEIEISIWQNPNPLSIRDKLRWIWQIVRWGDPFGDFVLLDIEQTTELRDYLSSLLVKMNEQV